MNKTLLKTTLAWGFLLWLIGYILGIVLFAIVPASMIGWIITPIGVALTLWVLFKKIVGESFGDYVKVGIIWTVIAIVCDYLFLVQLFHPADGYYKLDVWLYYGLTLVLPILVGMRVKKTAAPKIA